MVVWVSTICRSVASSLSSMSTQSSSMPVLEEFVGASILAGEGEGDPSAVIVDEVL
jgi:hypothetical protein